MFQTNKYTIKRQDASFHIANIYPQSHIIKLNQNLKYQ